MKLYGYWRSSATWRVRIALNLKGLSYEYVPVHLMQGGGQQRAPEHLARNPMGQVPVLEVEHGGQTHHLSQSMAIFDFLEQVAPSPPLYPPDPIQRARAIQLSELVNAGIQPLQNLSVLQRLTALEQDASAWAAHFIGRGLEALEAEAAHSAGRFLVAAAPCIADLCLIPQLYNARRYKVPLEGLPRLLAVEAACEELWAFQAAHPDQQPDANT